MLTEHKAYSKENTMVKENFPEHIAIILDGNRRWAKSKMLPIKLGHKQGAETLKKIAKYANEIGVKDLTVYAFSTENWKRSEEEVSSLMGLLASYLEEFAKTADIENIKIRVFGDITALNENLQKSINDTLERTKDNTALALNVCLNYGGRAEMVKATKEIAKEVKDGKIDLNDIDEKLMENHLYTCGLKDPDLLIRTSGELRTSGFLLWQLAYTEFIFLDKQWPEFEEKDLDYCIEEYQKRNRKFGGK